MNIKGTRERFLFWLDIANDENFAIADMITQLKAERKFTRTIRDGIRLIVDLRRGRVEVLEELFPWVFDAVARQLEEERSTQTNDIQCQLERIEQLIQTQTTSPSIGNGAPKAMDVKPVAAPLFDDDIDEFATIIIKPDTSTNSGQNFLNSLRALTSN